MNLNEISLTVFDAESKSNLIEIRFVVSVMKLG
jgi:hypothetical protein